MKRYAELSDKKVLFSTYDQWVIDYYVKRYGMTRDLVATRRRLACHRVPTLGKWERLHVVERCLTTDAARNLFHWLPPECLSPTFEKVRSHRPDVRLATIVEAAERRPYNGGRWWLVDWPALERVLDLPKDEIEGLVAMNRLRALTGAL